MCLNPDFINAASINVASINTASSSMNFTDSVVNNRGAHLALQRRGTAHQSPGRQQGSMLLTALFIIIVVSLLAAALSRIWSSTADSVATEVYSAKAYYAAESGMEYAMYQVLQAGLVCPDFPSPSRQLDFSVGNEPGLANCQTQISCQRIVIDSLSSQTYLLATGTCEGGKIVAQHQVEAEIK